MRCPVELNRFVNTSSILKISGDFLTLIRSGVAGRK